MGNQLYKNESWLRERYVIENLTRNKIAELCGVSESTIKNALRRFNIKKGHNNQRKKVIKYVIEHCKQCGDIAKKEIKYYRRRISEGASDFYCSRKCADKAHSERMKESGNPNYNGRWHGQCPSEWSKDKRKQATKKMVKTVLQNGTFRGKNNGRWAGGFQEHECVICGVISKFRPYVHRKIVTGERRPCCSVECAAALGRRNLKQERTSIELKMAKELDKRGLEYIEQYNLGDKFRLDFFIPKYGIVIECDGDYWHNLPEVMKRDRSKNAYIKACGYSLYRFWESEINTDVGACVDVVLAEINESEAIACRTY